MLKGEKDNGEIPDNPEFLLIRDRHHYRPYGRLFVAEAEELESRQYV